MKTSEQTAVKATYFSIVGNTCLAIIKGIAGVFGNSYALIADAIESTTDIFSSFLVLFGIKYSNRPADANHPYGHGRVEPLITFLVVGFLITSATIIAYESIANIGTPHELPKPWTLIVLGAIIIWKEYSYRLVMKSGIQTNSSSLKADAWHHRSDAITSVAAFAGISIALFLGKGYESADDWAALFASFFIIYNNLSLSLNYFMKIIYLFLFLSLSNFFFNSATFNLRESSFLLKLISMNSIFSMVLLKYKNGSYFLINMPWKYIPWKINKYFVLLL